MSSTADELSPASLLAWYKSQLRKRPLTTKSLSSAVIAALGELLSSALKRQRLSARRLLIFFAYGGLFVGPIMHWWYALLERHCRRYGAGTYGLLLRLLGDRLIMAPPFLLGSIFFLQTLLSGSVRGGAKAAREQFASVFSSSIKLWTPAQLVNFKLVPIEYRVLFGNLVAILWNAFLAMKMRG
uniref:Peroxisomal membrane protein 2 n=1 Tax=Pinguiococcus pyrenoidosus TaxID=172671 RepID=A0A7R9YBL3_9STRA